MTTPENGRTKQELSKAILRTADHLFTEHGVESVSMHQIAKSVGIGQGTLYRRYSNKGDLCMEMMKDNFNIFMSEIEDFTELEEAATVQSRLSEVMRRMISFVDQESKWLSVIHSHVRPEEQKWDFFQSPPYLYLHRIISELLQEAMDQKQIQPIDPSYVAHSYISMQSPIIYRHLRVVMGYSCEEIQDRFCKTFIDPMFR